MFRDATKDMVLVERWRRADDRTIEHQFTVSDPDTWTPVDGEDAVEQD